MPAQVPDWVFRLPAVNASLNAVATVLLLVGYALIRRGRVVAHRNTMLGAFAVSVLFLASYLTYHSYHLTKTFPPVPVLREVYWVILATHVVLAAAVPFLAVVTIWRALVRRDFVRHKRIARITYPIWLYVSVTGVVIYGMLYHVAPRYETPKPGAAPAFAAPRDRGPGLSRLDRCVRRPTIEIGALRAGPSWSPIRRPPMPKA